MTWQLIELIRDTPSVVAEGSRYRDWASAERAVTALTKDRTLWRELHKILVNLREDYSAGKMSTEQIRIAVDTAQRRHELAVVPAIGPDRVLYGAWWWDVQSADDPPPPPKTIAFDWSNTTRLARGRGALQILGEPAVERPITSTEIFETVAVDNDLEMIRKILLEPGPDSWDGEIHIRRSGATGRLVMATDPTDPEVWRGLLYDTEVVVPRRSRLEEQALAALALSTDRYLVLIDLRRFRVLRWLTRPMDMIQWKGTVDNRDAPHPDDMAAMFNLAAKAIMGEIREGHLEGMRMRARAGGWVVVNGTGILSGETEQPSLALLEITIVGHSDEPDPVPPTDNGHPGLIDL